VLCQIEGGYSRWLKMTRLPPIGDECHGTSTLLGTSKMKALTSLCEWDKARVRKQLPRAKVLEFFAQLPPCLIGIAIRASTKPGTRVLHH
jgi:hypothetical protein